VRVEIKEHIAELRRAGELLADAADRTDLDAPVPTCPGWRLRDLLKHTGYVHRWAARYVADGQVRRTPRAKEPELLRDGPADAALRGWFREGHAHLVTVLESAAPDLECWTFLEAPSPLAFWARRQAHETTIHRVDAQLAAAGTAGESPDAPGAVDPVPPELAADGIDELLMGFGRQVKPEGPLAAPTLSVAIRATSAGSAQAAGAAPEGGCWLVRMGRDKVEPFDISRGPATADPPAAGADAAGADAAGADGSADCAVAGPAAEIYLMLWNRRPADGIDLRGDESLLDVLRRELRITWH
jgi:uncharacterized protein (TIGR03083 family)